VYSIVYKNVFEAVCRTSK